VALSTLVFWGGIACIIYAYVGYPVLIGLAALCKPASAPSRARFSGSLSIVIAAYNEEGAIGRRLDELTGILRGSGLAGEIIVVSDGSVDRTAEVARQHATPVVRVLELPINRGKASALSAGCSAASGQVFVFADARQRWDADALSLLLESFAEPAIGAVGGELVLENDRGVMKGVSAYWRFEKWLRAREARVHSSVGVSGSIAAVRKSLFKGIPEGILLDDVYWPLQVNMQGYRVVFDTRARAYDTLPKETGDEFRRKVRTLSGNFQLVAALPSAVLPWRNPVWLQFISHKLLRLVVPWAYIATMLAAIVHGGQLYEAVAALQAVGLMISAAAVAIGDRSKSRLLAAAAALLILNAAAWVAFWVWIGGRAGASWSKAAYHESD